MTDWHPVQSISLLCGSWNRLQTYWDSVLHVKLWEMDGWMDLGTNGWTDGLHIYVLKHVVKTRLNYSQLILMFHIAFKIWQVTNSSIYDLHLLKALYMKADASLDVFPQIYYLCRESLCCQWDPLKLRFRNLSHSHLPCSHAAKVVSLAPASGSRPP